MNTSAVQLQDIHMQTHATYINLNINQTYLFYSRLNVLSRISRLVLPLKLFSIIHNYPITCIKLYQWQVRITKCHSFLQQDY